MKKNAIAIASFAVILLAGCGGGKTGVNSLDTLTTSATSDVSRGSKFPNQTRMLAMNGLLPVNGAGSFCHADEKRPSSALICYSQDGKTKVVQRFYDSGANLNDLRAMQKSLTNLQAKLIEFPTNNQKSAEQALEKVVTEARALQQDAAKNNIFIFRWNQKNSAGAEGGFGGLFSGQAQSEAFDSGVVIVSGLTVSQWLIGTQDYEAALSGYPQGTKLATLTMGAKNLLYFSEANLSAALAAELEGTLPQFKELSDEQKIALKAYAAIGRAQENQGALSASELKTYEVSSYLDGNLSKELVFYSTLTDVKTLNDYLSSTN